MFLPGVDRHMKKIDHFADNNPDCRLMKNESAKYWGDYAQQPEKTRMEDIYIVCTDNLTGFAVAIEAVFPKNRNSERHRLSDSKLQKYISHKNIKTLMSDLKAVYAAVDEAAALDARDAFSEHKVMQAKSVFPTDDSFLKMLYLAMMDVTRKWTG